MTRLDPSKWRLLDSRTRSNRPIREAPIDVGKRTEAAYR
jgi:hypothetical protein